MPIRLAPPLARLADDAAARLSDVLDLVAIDQLTRGHAALGAFGDAMAQYVRGRAGEAPGRSVAVWVRERLKRAEVDGAQLIGTHRLDVLLREAARKGLTRRASALGTDRSAYDESAVADLLGVPLRELLQLLRTAEGRRAAYHPLHIGRDRWRWQRVWVDDPTVQALRAMQPEPPHPVPLP